ncbi:hypothetical protein PPGU19_010780 [Paraburkholderia sp. PGU19]|nr:hypothetical protein PPGU19_010780 [Paraburkholderia sp. PGU19]
MDLPARAQRMGRPARGKDRSREAVGRASYARAHDRITETQRPPKNRATGASDNESAARRRGTRLMLAAKRNGKPLRSLATALAGVGHGARRMLSVRTTPGQRNLPPVTAPIAPRKRFDFSCFRLRAARRKLKTVAECVVR